jgi:predicted dehydrogenase
MKKRMAMIGGGEGSFIGPVHRMAASLDGLTELVAGAFSSDPELSRLSGANIGLPPERVYSDWRDMLSVESKRAPELRPHFITIVTPNYLHFDQIVESLKAGFNVVCDKPLAMNKEEAIKIEVLLKKSNKILCLTHNYTGYPMVKKARELVFDGSLGEIRKVAVEYFQGWLSTRVEDTDNRQAKWRADPKKAGESGCMADIGTHAFNLTEYITGKRVERVFAQLNRVVKNRTLDDDGTVILNFSDGTNGSLLASQVATGEENSLNIKVYGTKGSIYWNQMEPNSLVVRWIDKPYEVYRSATGFPQIGKTVGLHSRLPAGHPEGFIEAFANLYRNFALHIGAIEEGKREETFFDYPDITDGIRGMQFLDAIVKSSKSERWINLD